MKKLFLTPAIIFAFIFLTGCESRQDFITYLGPRQMNFLTTLAPGSTVTFDENGTRTSTTVSAATIDLVLAQENKGSIFGGGAIYKKQQGSVSYDILPSQSKIKISASSANLYSQDKETSNKIVVFNGSQASEYRIYFNNTIPSRIINGVTYTDVTLGIDSYTNDTLFWKKDIGILGWKNADQNYTAYRVF